MCNERCAVFAPRAEQSRAEQNKTEEAVVFGDVIEVQIFSSAKLEYVTVVVLVGRA